MARVGVPPSVYREIQRAEQGGLITSRKISNTRLVRASTPPAPNTAAAQLAEAEDDVGLACSDPVSDDGSPDCAVARVAAHPGWRP